MKFYEIYIGQTATLSHTISKKDIEKFVDLTGDDNKLHLDEKFAEKTSFKVPVVHGMLGASFISTIIGTKLPGDGALWFSQSLEFILPVRINDTITINAEVIKKIEGENIIEIKIEIYNQNKQIVTKGISKVKCVDFEIEKQINTEKKQIKNAIVLGASGGVGEATAIALAKKGFSLILHYHSNEKKIEQLKTDILALNSTITVHTVKADLTHKYEIENLIELAERKLQTITAFVNCATVAIPNIKFENLEWEDFEIQLNASIQSTFFALKKLVPHFIKNNYGKIVLIGSIVSEKPSPEWTPYITSKSALTGFFKSLAFDLSPKGICINMVSPSLIDTNLTANIPQKIKLLTASQTPVRRLADASDIANSIAFLLSEESDFISGETLRVNGGQLMI